MASPTDYTHFQHTSPRSSADIDERSTTTLLDEKRTLPYLDSTRKRWSTRRKLAFGGAGIALLAAIGAIAYGVIGIFVRMHLAPGEHGEFGDCGSSIEEAKAKGCIFDNLSYAWMQPPCYHGDLLEVFRARSNISYYTSGDFSLSSRIPQEDIYAGQWTEAYATKEQHPVHCAFMLSKMHEALLKHLPLDDKVMSFEHTIHCGQVLMQDWLHEIEDCNKGHCERAKVNMKFTTCGYY